MQLGEETSETSTSTPAPGQGMTDPLCEFLMEHDRLKSNDLKRAVNYQEQHGGDLVTLLVRLGLVSELDVAEAEATCSNCRWCALRTCRMKCRNCPGISVRYLKQNLILPIAESNGDLIVVMANPRDEVCQQGTVHGQWQKHIDRRSGSRPRSKTVLRNCSAADAARWARSSIAWVPVMKTIWKM